jgi:hypothetical protein
MSGTKVLTATEYAKLKAGYDQLSQFLTEDRMAVVRAIPGVQRISDSADETGVEIGYYCPDGECDTQAVRDRILASSDPEEATIADAITRYGISDIKVVVERRRWEAGPRRTKEPRQP